MRRAPDIHNLPLYDGHLPDIALDITNPVLIKATFPPPGHKLSGWNFRRVFSSQLPPSDRAKRYPADFGQKGTPMGGRLSRGRPATTINANTGREHYVVICRYFQLHGTKREFRSPPLKGDELKGNQPMISAEEVLGDEQLEPMLGTATPTDTTLANKTLSRTSTMKTKTQPTLARKRNRSPVVPYFGNLSPSDGIRIIDLFARNRKPPEPGWLKEAHSNFRHEITPNAKKRKISDTVYIADITDKEATRTANLAAVHANHARDLDSQVLD